MVRSDAPGTDSARVPHAEHRRRVPRTARLQIPNQLLELVTHEPQGQLEIHPLGGHEVLGAQKVARDREKRNTEGLVPLPADGESRRHRVPAVLLEMMTDALQGRVQVEPRDAPPGAASQLASLVP